MSDDKYQLHDWERNKIFPKLKNQSVSAYTSQVLLHLRPYLIDDLVENINKLIAKNAAEIDNSEALRQVMDYNLLRTKMDQKNRTVIPSDGWSRFLFN
jgi:DNA primase